MRVRRRPTIALLAGTCVLLALSLSPAPAVASGAANPVIADCLAHPGGLTGHYTVAELKHALQVMPAETKEYTSCPDVINRALLAALSTGSGTSGGSSSGSGSFLPTPVIIVLVVLVLAAITFGAIAIRRRQEAQRVGASGGAAGAGPNPGEASPGEANPGDGDPDRSGGDESDPDA